MAGSVLRPRPRKSDDATTTTQGRLLLPQFIFVVHNLVSMKPILHTCVLI